MDEQTARRAARVLARYGAVTDVEPTSGGVHALTVRTGAAAQVRVTVTYWGDGERPWSVATWDGDAWDSAGEWSTVVDVATAREVAALVAPWALARVAVVGEHGQTAIYVSSAGKCACGIESMYVSVTDGDELGRVYACDHHARQSVSAALTVGATLVAVTR